MSTPILATKLYIPPPRPKVVPRPRLIERLNESLHQKLTLISAPAGFGKTTLVSDWLHQSEVPAAWLSLDEGDKDPTRFLAYLVAALQTIAANIGEGVLAVLQSPQPPPTESILTALLNEITAIPDNFVLVLDDYHVVDAKPADNALTFLLEHLPPQMHLVIATREDPDLPLTRYRVRGQLTELRVTDLRFTPAEAAGFLNQVMGLNLSADEITALETCTEGWIAGLQMAALSMQGRADSASFIQAFTGSHHFVLDYLVEEVLQQQSESVQTFLLRTSILDRLCGSLCDAVCSYGTESSSFGTAVLRREADLQPTPAASGQETLEYIERANLLVVPLDDKRQWYRYHHLFADVLQARLMNEQPDQVPTLHQQASEWYEQNGLPSDAIRHALVAKDFERAAGLIELEVRAMLMSQEATLFGWLKALPDELVRTRPVLSVYYAFALLPAELDAAEARLRDAERLLDITADMSERPEAPSAEMVVVNEEEFRSLPGTISVARAYHAGALGDVPGTVKYARRALDLLPEGDYLWRGSAAALLGLAYWTSGDLEAAHRSLADGVASVRMAGDISAIMGVTYLLTDIRMALGRLREATNASQWAVQLAAEHGEPVPQGTADVYVELSELHREQDNLEAATQHLLTSKGLGEHVTVRETRHRWYVAMAQIKAAQGDLDGALDLLDEGSCPT
jgi:LuxR family maltose regulon positive regulatory protein